jgi:uncharacterized membrane protein
VRRIPPSIRSRFRFGKRGDTPVPSGSFWRGLGLHLRSRFTLGLVVLVPLLFTYFILRIFFDFLDSFLRPIFWRYGFQLPGLGLIALLIIIYLSGLVATNLVGRRVFAGVQQVLLRIPFVRTVYSIGKQLTDLFSGNHMPTGLSRVVASEYLRPGSWTIGFLTGFTTAEDGTLFAILYVPTAPLPNSGWLALLPADQVYDTNLTVNTAMQMVFSAGLVYPPNLIRKPLPEVVNGFTPAQAKREVAKPRV